MTRRGRSSFLVPLRSPELLLLVPRPPFQSRRAALAAVAATTAIALKPESANAAYGEAANVFGKATNTTGFAPYQGEGFALLLPSKWIPSKENDFARFGLKKQLRYEDNFDAVNTLMVLTQAANGSVKDFGSPQEFLTKYSFLFGQQAFSGETISEGGFAAGRVSAASVLDVEEQTDKKGRPTYYFNVLTRTADGDEGGRHHLIKATVANGNLWICKAQVGDKRWFKGIDKEAIGAVDSFTIA